MRNVAVFAIVFALVLPMCAENSRRIRISTKGPIGEGRAASGPMSSKMSVVSDLDARLAKYKPVRMTYHPKGLTVNERRMVEKLVQASQYIEDIFWRQSDPDGIELYKQLGRGTSPRDAKVRRYMFLNGGRFDLLNENKAFIGNDPTLPGRGLYPAGVTREKIEQYVKEHPDQKDAIYSGYTIVREFNGSLEAVPYHIAYRQYLQPAAKLLREAASLSSDKDFAEFLRLRADALLTDDYFKSDLKWLDLKNPKIDIIFAPYETYLDDLLGVKTSYGAAVMIRNDAESAKLALFEKFVPDIQDSLPLAAEDRPSKKGLETPMEVVDAPYRTGDLDHGYQAVADNLPNDPRIHEQKGSKKMFFKNFMDARVQYVILPLAKAMMRPDQAPLVTGDGYLAHTMMHEISHGLGPAFARIDGKQVDIREAIGPIYGGLEEAKADVLGMYGLLWLVDHGEMPKERVPEFCASYVGDLFRSARFGAGEAHGQAEMMEFNYLAEQGVINRDAQTGRYSIDVAKMPTVIHAFAKELLEMEATGDRKRTEAWFAKYDKMPADLETSLKATSGIPVDLAPTFSWPVKVR